MNEGSQSGPRVVTVSEFIAHAPAAMGLRFLAGAAGAPHRLIAAGRVRKVGLELTGYGRRETRDAVAVLGQSEIWYLENLGARDRETALDHLDLGNLGCVLVTRGLAPPPELISAAERAGLPLLETPLESSTLIPSIAGFLDELLAPRDVRHGVLMDLYGLGVLIEGDSGIGKSECALDLITRGHRLVSDDVVEVRRLAADRLIGSSPELLREHLEIRGLGILNVRDLFGVSAICGTKSIDILIRLERWDAAEEIDRLGIDDRYSEITGVRVPRVLIPVSPGRNLATLVETAARVHLLRLRGCDAAQAFVDRHSALLEFAGRNES